MSLPIEYDDFLNMHESPSKSRLNTIAESSESSSITVSPIDFSGELEAFLEPEDSSSPPKEGPHVSYWNCPRIPREKGQSRVQNYLVDVLGPADKQKLRQKRVRYDDLGASPTKRQKMEDRLEELQDDILSDSDTITLQMLALRGLQQDKAELISHVKLLEQENTRLIEINQQQTDLRLSGLKEYVKRRGQQLKRQGEFLVSMAAEETPAETVGSVV